VVIAIVFAGITPVPVTAKFKQDVVVMKNGDTLTGEIKRLEHGFLYFKADYMADTVQLDWRRVARIRTKDEFTILLTSGARYTGTLEKIPVADPSDEDFLVHTQGSGSSRSSSLDIVTITPMDESFWRQLTGSVNYGFTLTGGTSTTQSNFAGDVSYRSEKWAGKLDGSSEISRQNGAKNAGRNSVNLYYYNYRGTRWFVAGTASFLNSEQQDLTARATFGGGVGLDVLRRSTSSLQFVGGALLSNETYSPSTASKSGRGADAQLLLRFSKYARFTKFQFTNEFGAFPSLTTPGRVRMSLQSYVKREIFKNFNIMFSVYENYDSHPPVVAPKSDFGTTTSVGWSFP